MGPQVEHMMSKRLNLHKRSIVKLDKTNLLKTLPILAAINETENFHY